MRLNAELVVDSEPFTFTVQRGLVEVRAGKATNPEATLRTSYEPMIAVADGQLSLDAFASQYLEISGPNSSQGQALAELMARAMAYMTESA